MIERFAAWKSRQRPSLPTGDSLATPQEIYADLMKVAFAPALRASGLRGSGGRFELPSARYWAQLGFQKSVHNGGDEMRFTVNVSVVSRDEWARQSAADPCLSKRPSPQMDYGEWAQPTRIGELAPEGIDKWWRILRGSDGEAVRDDVLHDLLTYAVPWLKRKAEDPD